MFYNISPTQTYVEEIIDSATQDLEDLSIDKALQKLNKLCSLSPQLTKVDFINDALRLKPLNLVLYIKMLKRAFVISM